jgi:hypothetical protein
MHHVERVSIILWGLALYVSSAAQSPLFMRLDTTALNGIQVGEGILTADGGAMLHVLGSNGNSLWKCDASGTPQWRFKYPISQGIACDIASCDNNDVVVVQATDSLIAWDTIHPRFDVCRIGPNGEVVWHKRYDAGVMAGQFSPFSQAVSIRENDQGELLVLSHTAHSNLQHILVTKLSADGDVIWTRQVGTDPGTSFPCMELSCAGMITLYPDPQGGCRLSVPDLANSAESALIVSLANDGTLEWARQFDYLGLTNSSYIAPHVVLNDGTTVLLTLTASLNGGLHLVYITDEGSLERVDRFDSYTNCCSGLAYDQNTLVMRQYESFFILDQSGSILSGSKQLQIEGDTAFQYSIGSTSFDFRNGKAMHSGGYIVLPTGPELPMASPYISTFGVEDPLSCYRASDTLPHEVLPNANFTCSPNDQISSVALGTSVIELIITLDTMTLFGSINLCSSVSLPPETEPIPGFSVDRTLLNTDEPVMVISDRPLRYSLFDTHGVLVREHRSASQRAEIPTSALADGLYLLIGQDQSGRKAGTAKLVIAR